MRYILEITTKIGCINMCEYCPQTKLVRRYLKNAHITNLKNNLLSAGDDINNPHMLFMDEYLKQDKNRETMMSLETFKKCLSTVDESVDIHFAGYTEAFENPAAIDMVEYAYHKGHKTLVNTTLMCITKDQIDRLSKLKFKEFNLHLPSKTYFENIGRNTAAKRKETGKIISDEYLDLVDYMLDAKINKHWHTHSANPDDLDKKYMLHPEIAEHAGERILSQGYKNRGLNSRAGNLGKLTGEALWKNNWCNRIIHNILLPDGNVQLCCQDYGLEEPIGNLLHMPYHTLFETNRFKEIQAGKASICQRCDDGIAVPKNSKMKLGYQMQNYEDEWRISKFKDKHENRKQ